MSQGTTFIYTLNDPDTGKIRYVGKADDPLKRFKDHLRDRTINHRTNWIKSLASADKRPVLEILDEVPKTEWEFWEKEYIRVFRMIGMNLVNSTEGGEAPMSGRKSSLQTRTKLKNWWTSERRQAFSVLKTGIKTGPHSLEWNKKISKGNTGKAIPVEVRKRISETLTGMKTTRNTSGFVGGLESGKILASSHYDFPQNKIYREFS